MAVFIRSDSHRNMNNEKEKFKKFFYFYRGKKSCKKNQLNRMTQLSCERLMDHGNVYKFPFAPICIIIITYVYACFSCYV